LAVNKVKILSRLRLIRPINCLMVGFAVIVGAYVAQPRIAINSSFVNLSLGFLTGFCLTGASMAINDYFDRFIDAVNEPSRPIPSGAVKPLEALVYGAILTALGLTASLLVNFPSFLAAIIAWILFSGYTIRGKRMGFLGNLMVSGCIATPFIYGSLVIGVFSLNNFLFAAMAFLSNTGREVIKGIVDTSGDKIHGIKTIAVLWGEKRAAYVASMLYLCAVILSTVPWILGLVSIRYLALVGMTDTGFIFTSIFLSNNPSRERARRVKRTVLIWMLLAMLAFLSG